MSLNRKLPTNKSHNFEFVDSEDVDEFLSAANSKSNNIILSPLKINSVPLAFYSFTNYIGA